MDIEIITLPSDQITDWETFHAVFQSVFGFPEFYGRNMNAWNDCMTYLDDPDGGLSSVTIAKGGWSSSPPRSAPRRIGGGRSESYLDLYMVKSQTSRRKLTVKPEGDCYDFPSRVTDIQVGFARRRSLPSTEYGGRPILR
jgi:hypothetical protein